MHSAPSCRALRVRLDTQSWHLRCRDERRRHCRRLLPNRLHSRDVAQAGLLEHSADTEWSEGGCVCPGVCLWLCIRSAKRLRSLPSHRGLPLQTFLYALCQYSMRTLVSKVYNFGISPRIEKSIRVEDTNFGQMFKQAGSTS